MTGWHVLAIIAISTPVVVGLVMAGADRLVNHVDQPERGDPTAPDQTAPGVGKSDAYDGAAFGVYREPGDDRRCFDGHLGPYHLFEFGRASCRCGAVPAPTSLPGPGERSPR